jgi:hypothetical protein
MKDLKLNEDRETLKRILEQAIPGIARFVLIYASDGKGRHLVRELREDLSPMH